MSTAPWRWVGPARARAPRPLPGHAHPVSWRREPQQAAAGEREDRASRGPAPACSFSLARSGGRAEETSRAPAAAAAGGEAWASACGRLDPRNARAPHPRPGHGGTRRDGRWSRRRRGWERPAGLWGRPVSAAAANAAAANAAAANAPQAGPGHHFVLVHLSGGRLLLLLVHLHFHGRRGGLGLRASGRPGARPHIRPRADEPLRHLGGGPKLVQLRAQVSGGRGGRALGAPGWGCDRPPPFPFHPVPSPKGTPPP